MTERYAAVIIYADFDEQQFKELYKAWKEQGCTSPFIILTRRQSGLQRARLLECGVDFYVIQPVSYTSLVSTILLREYQNCPMPADSFRTTHFEIDILRRSVSCDGELLSLTRREFEIFSFLLRYRGIVLSRSQIWEEVWGYERIPETNVVDVHIARLRRKLPRHMRSLISTVHGIGYRLDVGA